MTNSPRHSTEYRRMSPEGRWWFNVIVDSSGCWLWQGALAQGYGHLKVKGKSHPAHRFGYEMLIESIPPELVCDHLCRVRHCVNPDHIDITDHKTNILRGVGRGAKEARQTECKQGHPLNGENLRIDTRGRRVCQTCTLKYLVEWRKRNKDKTREYSRKRMEKIRFLLDGEDR